MQLDCGGTPRLTSPRLRGARATEGEGSRKDLEAAATLSVAAYLESHQKKLLRFITCGSVDDEEEARGLLLMQLDESVGSRKDLEAAATLSVALAPLAGRGEVRGACR